jgi:hypothetical protein
MGGRKPEPQFSWNPATGLVEIAIYRRNGQELIIKNLPLRTAEKLREAIADALRKGYE